MLYTCYFVQTSEHFSFSLSDDVDGDVMIGTLILSILSFTNHHQPKTSPLGCWEEILSLLF